LTRRIAVTPTTPSLAGFREPVDRAVFEPGFEPGFGLWQRESQMPRRLWAAVVSLPDRGDDALPDDVPAEFFRFPPF
jgi:hypothetical protein